VNKNNKRKKSKKIYNIVKSSLKYNVRCRFIIILSFRIKNLLRWWFCKPSTPMILQTFHSDVKTFQSDDFANFTLWWFCKTQCNECIPCIGLLGSLNFMGTIYFKMHEACANLNLVRAKRFAVGQWMTIPSIIPSYDANCNIPCTAIYTLNIAIIFFNQYM